MKAWRIVLRRFGASKQAAFSGLSGFSADGRWHSSGRYLDYTAESLSLATLERLVHYKRFDALQPHVLYTIDVPPAAIEEAAALPAGWDADDPLVAAQIIGNRWCGQQRSPALRVASAITPGEHNLIVNAHHPAWRWSWVTSGPRRFSFEPRIAALVKKPARHR